MYGDELVDNFYTTILQVPELKMMIEENSTQDHLRRALKTHLIDLFGGTIDQEFIRQQIIIAKTHYRLGLPPSDYMGAFQNLQNTLLSIVFSEMDDAADTQRVIAAINKMISFEQQLVLEAYDEEIRKRMTDQFDEGKNVLKTAMTEVSEGLVALAEETQAAAEMLSSTIRKVSDTAGESNEQASLAKKAADEGQNRLAELAEKVFVIEQYTERMTDSIGQHRTASDSSVTRMAKSLR